MEEDRRRELLELAEKQQRAEEERRRQAEELQQLEIKPRSNQTTAENGRRQDAQKGEGERKTQLTADFSFRQAGLMYLFVLGVIGVIILLKSTVWGPHADAQLRADARGRDGGVR